MYEEYTCMEAGLHIAVIAMLILLRIVSIRFSQTPSINSQLPKK